MLWSSRHAEQTKNFDIPVRVRSVSPRKYKTLFAALSRVLPRLMEINDKQEFEIHLTRVS